MKPANWLFVQVADSVTVDDKTITLKGIAPQTLMFLRPSGAHDRDAPTPAFVSSGPAARAISRRTPPNATIAVTG